MGSGRLVRMSDLEHPADAAVNLMDGPLCTDQAPIAYEPCLAPTS